MFTNERPLDFDAFDRVRKKAYDLQIDDDGVLWGLVAGDQNYDSTDIRLTDLVGSALAVAEKRGRSQAREWGGANDLQAALGLLISISRNILRPA